MVIEREVIEHLLTLLEVERRESSRRPCPRESALSG